MAKKVSIKTKVNEAKAALVLDATPEAAKNVSKLEGDMEFNVQNLRDKISEARTMTELESTQDMFEVIYGVGAEIPPDIQDLYNSKMAEIKAIMGDVSDLPIGWIKMSREEAKENERKGLLCGYDANRRCGLIKQ